MNTDTFLEIGSHHKICEDYIIQDRGHLINPKYEIPFIVLSDGCSTSPNTEMGSRILCHLAKQYLKFRTDYPINYEKMGLWVIHNAELVARQMGLHPQCLNATLIVAYQYDGKIFTHFYGDGCVIVKHKNLGVVVHIVEYGQNAPYYLAYQLNEKDHDVYDKLNLDKTITSIYEDGTTKIVERAYDVETVLTSPDDTIELLLIASDGLQTFIKKEGSTIEKFAVSDIINTCIDFKTTEGSFLKRRMKKQMKVYADEGINHYDDLSVGAFINT